MASTGIASYGSTDSETKPPLKRTMPTRFVQLFRERLSAALSFVEPTTNKRLGKCVGVYAFYDFDGEPIYVGQTTEEVSVATLSPTEFWIRLKSRKLSSFRRIICSTSIPIGKREVRHSIRWSTPCTSTPSKSRATMQSSMRRFRLFLLSSIYRSLIAST